VPLGPNDPAARVLPPKAAESDEVLNNRNGSQQRCTDTEDGVCRELVARQAIPHAKVKANGHAHAVEEDQGPEPEDGLLPRSQRVV
jgi:hypothetical protein